MSVVVQGFSTQDSLRATRFIDDNDDEDCHKNGWMKD